MMEAQSHTDEWAEQVDGDWVARAECPTESVLLGNSVLCWGRQVP